MDIAHIFMLPGAYALVLIFQILQLSPEVIDPLMLRIGAGILSWIFWMGALRALWAVTCAIFGLNQHRGMRG